MEHVFKFLLRRRLELSPKQGIVSAIWQFAMEYDDNALKENAVCDWKKAYNIEMKSG